MEKLLRLLLVLLGIGVGLAAAQLGLALFRLSHQNADIPTWVPLASYTGMAVLGGLLLMLLSGRIIRRVSTFSMEMQKEFDKMPANQLLSAIIGLILGLIVAALLRQMLSFFGTGVAGAALTAILYLTLGALGYNIGKRRSREFITMITRLKGSLSFPSLWWMSSSMWPIPRMIPGGSGAGGAWKSCGRCGTA